MTNNQSHILVSICCITYNHASFIGKAIEGFLMQEPPTGVSADEPWYEILIHDDASTDGTTEIIKEYAAKYPDKIFPLYETVNQYTNGHKGDIDFFNYKRARGKYIAYCEGDDFWTVPDKLKRQIDFMESHPDYSVCWHLARIYETDTKKLRPLHYDYDKPIDEDEDITPEYFLRCSAGQPLSMVFRRDMYDFDWQKHYSNYCDTMEEFHLLRVGKGRQMKFIGGQYNLQVGGVSATQSDVDRSLDTCVDYLQMYAYTRESILESYIYKTFLWSYRLCRQSNKKKEWNRVMHQLRKASFAMWMKVNFKIIKTQLRQLWK